MAMVIDSLVVELGLDPKKFTDSQREALSSLRRFEEEAESQGKRVESQTKRINDLLLNFKREALGVFGLFMGGTGAAAFINFLTTADAATGRLSKTVGMSAQEIAIWQGAIRQMGGSAESANAGIAGLNAEVIRFSQTGQSQALGVLSRLGVALQDTNGKWKTAGQLYRDFSEAVATSKISQRDAAGFLAMIPGVNQDFINLILDGKLAARLEASRKAGVPTPEDTERAQKFQGALSLLTQAAENAGRALLNVMYPGLTAVANGLRELIALSPGTAGVIGAIGTILGFRAAWRGARSLLTRAAPAAAAAAATGAGAGAGGAAVGAGTGGAAAATAAKAGGGWMSGAAARLLGPLGFYFGSTEEAGAPTLTDRWDKPFMGPEGSQAPSQENRSLPAKPGSGQVSPAMKRVSEILSGVPDVRQATSFNDPYHALLGGGSAHSAGRAVDVTIKDPSKSGEVAAKIKAALAAQGINATVLDEYKNPSRNSTGGHIHVGIDAPTALGLAGGAPRVGAAGAAASSIDNRSSRGGDQSSNSTSIQIDKIEVKNAQDGESVVRQIEPALKRAVDAGQFNYGQN